MRSLVALPLATVLACLGCRGEESRSPAPAVQVEAAEGDVRMTVQLDRDTVEVGQAIRLTLSLSSDGSPLPAPTLPPTLGPFEVRPLPTPASPSEAGERQAAFELSTLDAGGLEIPSIEVPLGGGDGQRFLRSPAIPVTVTSLIGEDSDPAHFRDIKGPLDLVPREVPWGLVVGGLATLAALAVMGWLLLRRRGEALEPPLAPDEWARREFDRLASAGLLESGRCHDFHVLLTDIVRGYIERRYGIRAPELTTPEFLRESKRAASIEEAHQTLLAGFLRHADLIKFAGIRPAAGDSIAALETARRFVEESKPRAAAHLREAEEARGAAA